MQRKQPWFIGAALRALGKQVHNTARTFTARELAGWDSGLTERPGLAKMALKRMHNHLMVAPVPASATTASAAVRSEQQWCLTTKGLATCRAVVQAQPGAAMPDPNALSTKLWSLLRIRRRLTSDEAACHLVDAGDPQELIRTQRTIAGYLRAWSEQFPDAVKVAAQREAGCKRYVMVKDLGVTPPPTKGSGIPLVTAPKAHPAPASRTAGTE